MKTIILFISIMFLPASLGPGETVRGFEVPRVLTSKGFAAAMRFHGPNAERRINPDNGSLEFKRNGQWILVLTKGCMESLKKGNHNG